MKDYKSIFVDRAALTVDNFDWSADEAEFLADNQIMFSVRPQDATKVVINYPRDSDWDEVTGVDGVPTILRVKNPAEFNGATMVCTSAYGFRPGVETEYYCNKVYVDMTWATNLDSRASNPTESVKSMINSYLGEEEPTPVKLVVDKATVERVGKWKLFSNVLSTTPTFRKIVDSFPKLGDMGYTAETIKAAVGKTDSPEMNKLADDFKKVVGWDLVDYNFDVFEALTAGIK